MSTEPRLRALLVEDSEADAELVLRALRRGGYALDYLRVETPEAMAAALDEGGWEIVLSDYSLPRFNAPAALELLQSTGLDVPFIIISGTVGEETAVRCMKAGARDFLLKGNLTRLVAAVQRELHAARDRRTQREEEQRLHELEQARDLAERESSFKSQFLANMSHELRTPLNAIIGFSEVLVDRKLGPLNDTQAGCIENILSSGRHLLNLINDVLDLSKVAAGRMELHLVRLAVPPLVAQVVAAVQPLAQVKDVGIEQSIRGPLPEVMADSGRLTQILFNLLSNAVKFTPTGGTIAVRMELAEGEGPCAGGLRISVSDTGIGIRPEDQERIFREFEQVRSAYSRSVQGTGLGLALTRRLVELHGGRLWVESAGEGRGSTFCFTLPLGSAATPAVG